MCLGFILTSYVPLPEDTHYFATHLDQWASMDAAKRIYQFIASPGMIMISGLYDYPFWYGLTSYAAEILFGSLLLFIIFKSSKNLALATFIVVVFSPLSLGLANFIVTLGYSVGPLPDLFLLRGPGLDWGNLNLSPRLLFAFIFSSAILFFCKGKYIYLCIAVILMLNAHANSGLLGSAIILFTAFVLTVNARLDHKILMAIVSAILVGSAPLLVKLMFATTPIDVVSNEIWYTNMIRDEADDFSFLWLLSFMPNALVTYFSFWAFTLFLYRRMVPEFNWLTPLTLLAVIPQLIFVSLMIVEFTSVYFNNFSFIRPVISLTANLKVLGFTFVPGLLIWAKILSPAFAIIAQKKSLEYLANSVLIIFAVTVLALPKETGLATKIDHFNAAFEQGKIERYSQIVRLGSQFNNYNYNFAAVIYEMPVRETNFYRGNNVLEFDDAFSTNPMELNENYYQIYEGVDSLEGLVYSIIDNVPVGTGLIVPPYLNMLRESLIDYNLFFQERHDGNLMMGSPAFATELLARMKALLGHSYAGLPTLTSGYQNTFLRESFLKVDEDRLLALTGKYPNFSIFITEVAHKLDFPVIYKDEKYIFYQVIIDS